MIHDTLTTGILLGSASLIFFLLFLFLGADFLCLCPADKWLSEAAAGGSVFLDARGGMVVVGVCVRSEGVCVRQ